MTMLGTRSVDEPATAVDAGAGWRALAGNGVVRVDLSGSGIISGQGSDAARVLHGQLTNDVLALGIGRSCLAAWCSHKGRVLALFRLTRLEDRLELEAPRSRVPALIARLRLFVLRADARFEDSSDASRRVGLAGSAAAALLEEVLGAVPGAGETIVCGDHRAASLPGEVPRFVLHLDPGSASEAQAAIASRSIPAGIDLWRLLGIRAGVPEVEEPVADEYIPQMLNLDLLGAINFDKGCYSGQEVVARTQYLGRVKRRTYRASGTGPPPTAGTPVLADAESVGAVIGSAQCEDGRFEVLAVLRTDAADAALRLGENGPPLRLEPLPYRLDG